MLRRLFLMTLASAWLGTSLLWGADNPTPKAPTEPKTSAEMSEAERLREQVLLKQTIMAQKFRTLEFSFRGLAQRLERSGKPEDKKKAAVLLQVLETANKAGTDARFARILELLKDAKSKNVADIDEALDLCESVIGDLDEILGLLLKDGEADGSRALQKRLEALIQLLDKAIRDEKIVRIHTEKGTKEKNDLGKLQDGVADSTDELAKDMEDKNRPGADRLPGKDLVRSAVGDERTASRHITDDKNEDAGNAESTAIRKLVQARDALDKLLKQLRAQEQKALLIGLLARCQIMLQAETEVREATVKIEKSVNESEEKKPSRAEVARALTQEEKQKFILQEADKARQMLKDEGSAVAFVEVFEQLRGDMEIVRKRLGKADVGEVTQSVEQDIIDTLKEMIDALDPNKKPTGTGRTPPMPPNGNPPGNDDEGRLVTRVQELKMVRSLQVKLNNRTDLYAKKYTGESPEDPAIRKEVQDLSGRQQAIQRVLKNLPEKKD